MIIRRIKLESIRWTGFDWEHDAKELDDTNPNAGCSSYMIPGLATTDEDGNVSRPVSVVHTLTPEGKWLYSYEPMEVQCWHCGRKYDIDEVETEYLPPVVDEEDEIAVDICPKCARHDPLGEDFEIKFETIEEALERKRQMRYRPEARTFFLFRFEDATGISGMGVVAEGVQFGDGTVVLRWLTEHRSTAVYENMATAIKIHGHDGKTRFIWGDVRAGDRVLVDDDEKGSVHLGTARELNCMEEWWVHRDDEEDPEMDNAYQKHQLVSEARDCSWLGRAALWSKEIEEEEEA